MAETPTPEKIAQMVQAMNIQQQQQALSIMKGAIAQGKPLNPMQQQLMMHLEVQSVVQSMTPEQRKQAVAMLKTAVSKGTALNAQQALLLSSLEVAIGEVTAVPVAEPPTSPPPTSPTSPSSGELEAAAKAKAEAEARAQAEAAEKARIAEEKARAAEEKARAAAEAKAAKERAAAEEKAAREKAAAEEKAAREKAAAEERAEKQRIAEEKARQEAEAKAAKKRAEEEAKAQREKEKKAAEAKALEEKKAAEALKAERRASTAGGLKTQTSKSSLSGDMPKPWIYGRLSRDEARDILIKNMVKGHFLVRQSNTIPGGFALSLLVASNDPEPEHHVLHPDDKGHYTINGQPLGKVCTTIQETVEYLIANGHTGMTCKITDVVYNK